MCLKSSTEREIKLFSYLYSRVSLGDLLRPAVAIFVIAVAGCFPKERKSLNLPGGLAVQ